jgi:hypothetical protein
MKLDRHEADSTRTYLGYPHAPLFRCADVLYRPPLIFPPVRMQPPENLRTQHPFERREDRRPRPKREVDHRLGVSIVKWPNLLQYRCHLSTLTETTPSHPTYSPQYFSHRCHQSYVAASMHRSAAQDGRPPLRPPRATRRPAYATVGVQELQRPC